MSKEKLTKLQKEVINKSNKNLDKKGLDKLEKQKRQLSIFAAKNAMYKANQEKIDAPFGKAFKTGKHKSKLDYNRGKTKHSKNIEY
ncbi:MAG: hypothetical protein WCO35_01870 [Candidatus Nomurabacteria bacterium]